MALRKLERRNYGGKSPVSIKYQNLHTLKEGLILLCQSILETRRVTHLHGLAHLIIPLREDLKKIWKNTFYFKLKVFLFSRLLIQSFTLFLLPSRKLPLFCSFSDVIECLTTYGKGCFLKYLKNNNEYLLALWCSGYHYCTTSFNKARTQVLHRFKSCLWHVGDLR